MGTGFFESNKTQLEEELLYAGDVSCVDAWELLQSDDTSVLVDVRTIAEWSFVGGVNLSSANKSAIYVQWNVYPQMNINPDFVQQIEKSLGGDKKDRKIFFLCRSGARSLAAAKEMTRHGYSHCYNVSEGFEGDVDNKGHRGMKNGWKSHNLPWEQK